MRFSNLSARFAFALAVAAICAVPISSHAQGAGPGPGGACDTVLGCAPEPLPTLVAAENPETGLPAIFEVNLVTGVMELVTDVTLSAEAPVCASSPLAELDRLLAIEFNEEGELFGFGWDLGVFGSSTMFTPVGSLLKINLETGTAHALCPLPVGFYGYVYTAGINIHPIVADGVVGSTGTEDVIAPVTLAAGTHFALNAQVVDPQLWLNPLNGVPTGLPGASPYTDWEMVCRGFTVSNSATESKRFFLCANAAPSFDSPPTYIVRVGPDNRFLTSEFFTTVTGEPLTGKVLDLHCDGSVCVAPADRSYRDPETNELVRQQPVIYTFRVDLAPDGVNLVVSSAEVIPLTYAGFLLEETPVPEDVFFEVGPWSAVVPEIGQLEEVLDFLIECPEEDPPPWLPCVRPSFRSEMGHLKRAASSAQWSEAAMLVHTLMQATDGCMFRGAPDSDDGIVGCELQETVSVLPDGTQVPGLTDVGAQRLVHGALNRIFVETAKAAMRQETIRDKLERAKAAKFATTQ